MSYASQVVADGASHYWRLGEPSGTTAADSVAGGANAPGTISGGVTLGQAGPLADGSTAMVFNGTTGKVQTAVNLSLLLPLTIEAWIRGTWAADSGVVSNTAGGDGTGDFLMLGVVGPGQGRPYLEYSAGGARNVPATVVLNNNQWHYVVGIFSDSGTPGNALYVDGVADGASGGLSAVGSTNKPLAIGSSVKYAQFFPGAIAEVAVYPFALSPAQIATHYALRTATAGGGRRAAIPWSAYAQQGTP